MSIADRYATAIRSSCLTVDYRTDRSDTDVLGAMGLADRELTDGRTWDGRHVPKAPLAVSLERLFLGDNTAAFTIVRELTEWLRGKAPAMRLKMTEVQCGDMAKACLAWHRDSICKHCGGHGQGLIKGSRTLGGSICKHCKGTGRIPFERQFRHEHRDLARWLVGEMEREQGRAAPAAMKKIAESMVF